MKNQYVEPLLSSVYTVTIAVLMEKGGIYFDLLLKACCLMRMTVQIHVMPTLPFYIKQYRRNIFRKQSFGSVVTKYQRIFSLTTGIFYLIFIEHDKQIFLIEIEIYIYYCLYVLQ